MPTIFKKVDVIYDFKTAIAPYVNSAIVYSQVPHKLVFKRHRVTGRCHMTYAVFSGEPMQPPEPKFNFVGETPGADVLVEPFFHVGGRTSFIQHLGIGQSATELSLDQANTLATMGMLESEGVFDRIQTDSLSERDRRYGCYAQS